MPANTKPVMGWIGLGDVSRRGCRGPRKICLCATRMPALPVGVLPMKFRHGGKLLLGISGGSDVREGRRPKRTKATIWAEEDS